MNNFVEKELAKGTIIPSESTQASPVFFVGKKDGSLRPCQDYRYVNSKTIKNAFPLPLIPPLLHKLRDAKYFTKFDIRQGYNNLRIDPNDRWKTAFVTEKGLFEPTVMFFGLCNSPPAFQAWMNHIFHIEIEEGWLIVYMDDILIFSLNLDEHHDQTNRVLEILVKEHLFLRPSKCVFDAEEVEYLGMVIKHRSVAMDPAKIRGISDWPVPKTLTETRLFLGACNFYRNFIPAYSTVARPLINLTKKNTPFQFGKEQLMAFAEMKQLFISAPVLVNPDPQHPFAIATDASLVATGAVLLQKDLNGDYHPCFYYSQSLNPAEQNYQIYDRELLAVVKAIKQWQPFLLGSDFPIIVYTDHLNLAYFRTPQNLTPRQSRWQFFLSEYDLKFTHVAGISPILRLHQEKPLGYIALYSSI